MYPHPGPTGPIPTFGIARKFGALGTLAGRTLQEIVTVVGPPDSSTINGPGLHVAQWLKSGYHIVLIFDDNGVCGGVTHESSF